MILVGKFNEAQLDAKEDKAACERVKKESGGKIHYFTAKVRRRKGKEFLEVYGMTTEEYCGCGAL